MTTTARKIHQYVPNHIAMTVAWNTAGLAAGVEMPNRLPAGAVINKVTVLTTAAFNAATTAALSVGSTATGTQYINATDVKTVAARVDTQTPVAVAGPLNADTQVFVSVAQTGTAATAGSSTVIIEYFPVVG